MAVTLPLAEIRWSQVRPWSRRRAGGRPHDRCRKAGFKGGTANQVPGLVSIACPAEAFPIYAASDPGTIVTTLDSIDSFADLMADLRRNAVLIGPGAGISAATRHRVEEALESGKAVVIDADAITAFTEHSEELFRRLTERCLLTPHAGEFKRLFGIDGDKLSQARAAASRAGAVVLLKGADPTIARPDGHAIINGNAPALACDGGCRRCAGGIGSWVDSARNAGLRCSRGGCLAAR